MDKTDYLILYDKKAMIRNSNIPEYKQKVAGG